MFKPGDFSFFNDPTFSETLEHDYTIVESNNLWTVLKTRDPNKPFIFDTSFSCYNWSNNHSGASLAISLRNMEMIAKNGWEHYIQLCSKPQK
jgi:hypothetical protein